MRHEIPDKERIIDGLANLFPDATDMSDLDAADFKDNASAIFSLVLQARSVRSKPPHFFVFQLCFDDHDSYYQVPTSIARRILDGERPISEVVVDNCKAASISSDAEVDFTVVADNEDESWGEIRDDLLSCVERIEGGDR